MGKKRSADDIGFSKRIRNIPVSSNFCIIIFVFIMYLSEGALITYRDYYKIIEFTGRPHYSNYSGKVVSEDLLDEKSSSYYADTSTISFDCRDYGDEDNYFADFVNDYPDTLALVFYASFCIVFIVQSLMDIGIRIFKSIQKKNNNYDSGKDNAAKDIGALINFIFPIYKIICLAILYPITFFKYNDCFDGGKYEILMKSVFYHYLICGGFVLVCGLLSCCVLVMMDSKLKYLIAFLFLTPSLGTFIVWLIGVAVLLCIEESKNSSDGEKLFMCGCCIFFFVVAITAIIFIIFSLIVIPIFTYSTFTITIYGLQILKLIILPCISRCCKDS